MSTYVENQVVELEFDNRDFEKNVSTSLKTLETLKEKLKFENASKGFQEIQNGLNSINFTPFLGQLDNMESQFVSFMGRLELNIKDFLAGETIAKFQELFATTIGQIKSGGRSRAQNIEQAQFKIKGLEKDWNKVYEDMDYAVSGTAYGIDQAANAAAQFLASNVHTGEDMKAALRGISGIAAMTSSGYDEIARVFTAAAGKGRVMALELNRISLRGVNAAAALAKYLDTTEAQVRKLASEGQISFQTFAYAMDAAFGEHAKKANETFAGSLANVRAALSRIGEIYYEPWIRSMIPFFNALRTAIDGVKNALKGLVGTDEEGNKVFDANNVAANLKNLLLTVGDLKTEIVKSFIPSLDGLTSRFDWLNEKLQNATITIRAITEAFKKYNKIKGSTEKKVEEQAKESSVVTSSEDPKFLGLSTQIAGVAITLDKEVGATVTSIIDRYKALYDAQKSTLQSTTNLFSKWTYQYKTSFSELNKALKSNKWGLETLSKDMAKLEGKGILSTKFIERLKSMGSSGAEIVHALANATDKDLKEYMQTWEQTEGMFDTISGEWTKDAKKQAEDSLNQITGIPQATMEDYMNTFGDMFKQLGISDAAGYSQGFLQSFESMETLYARQLDAIDEYNKKMQEAADAREAEEDAEAAKKNKYKATYEIIENYTERLYKAMTSNKIIVNVIDNMQQTFRDLFATLQEIGHRIYEIFEAIGGAYIEVWKKFNVVDGEVVLNPIQKLISLLRFLIENFQISGERAELIKSTFKGVFAVFELVKWAINNLIDAIAPFLITLSQGEPIILRVTGALGEFVTAIVNRIINGEPIGDALDNLLGSIRGFFSGLLDLLKGDGKESEGLLGNIFDGIKDAFDTVVTFLTGLFSNPEGKIDGTGFGDFIKTLFGEIFNVERLSEVLGDAFEYLKITFDDVWGIADTFLTIIPDILSTAWGFIKDNSEAISGLLLAIINLVTKIIDKISEADGPGDKLGETFAAFCDLLIALFTTLKEIIVSLKEPVIAIATSISEIVKKFMEIFSRYSDWMANEDPEKMFGKASFILIMTYLIKRLDAKKTKPIAKFLDRMTGGVKGVTTEISGFFKTLTAGIKGVTVNETLMDKIRKLAVSLLIFAAAIYILTKAFMTDDGKINPAAIAATVVVFSYLFTVIWLIDKLFKLQRRDISKSIEEMAMTRIFRSLAVSMAILAISIGIFVKLIGSTEHVWEAALAGFLILALLMTVMYAMVKMMINQSEKDITQGLVAEKKMKAMGFLFLSVAVALSMVMLSITPFIGICGLLLNFMDQNQAFDLISLTVLTLVVILGGMLLLVKTMTSDYGTYNTASMFGMAAFIVAFSIGLGIIMGSLVAMLAVMAIVDATNAQGILIASFGGIAVLMLMMVVVMKAIAKATSYGGSQMLAGLVGISILCVALSALILTVTGMITAFKLAGVTSDDISAVLPLLITIGTILVLMVGIFAAVGILAGGDKAGAAVAAILIISIAAAIYIIISAITKLAITLAILFGVFELGAALYPLIKDNMDDFLKFLDDKVPEFIKIVGKGIRALSIEIVKSAPYIANAIMSIFTYTLLVTKQKIPIYALTWLMMIDETLTIILAGAPIIIDKLLALLGMVIIALDANAPVLGYEIGHTLMIAFMYGLEGAYDALKEYIADWVDKYYDELIGSWADKMSNSALSERIGDMMYKHMTGKSIQEDIAALNEEGYIHFDANGKIVGRYKDGEEAIASAANSYSKAADDAKKKVDEANDAVDDAADNGTKKKEIKWETDIDYQGLDKTDESLKDSKEFQDLQKEYNVSNEDLDRATEIKNSGEEDGKNYSDGFKIGTGYSMGEGLLNLFGFGDNAAKDSGTADGKSYFEGFKSKLSEMFSSDKIGSGGIFESIIPSTDMFTGTDGSLLSGSMDGALVDKLGILNGSGESVDELNTDDILPTDGSTTGLLDILGGGSEEGGLMGLLGGNSEQLEISSNNTAELNETNSKMMEVLNEINAKLNNIAMVNKDTKLNVTAAIDGQECGNVLYPIMESIAAQKASMEEAGVAH